MICDLSWDCDSYSLAPWLVFTKIRKDVFQFLTDFCFSSFQNFKLSYFLLKANIHLLYFTILTKSNNFEILSNTIFYILYSMHLMPILLTSGHFPLRLIDGGPSVCLSV